MQDIPQKRSQKGWTTAFVLASAVACYVGFAPVNKFAVTILNISVFDGFYRRALVGTVFRPLWAVTNYSYWTYLTLSVLVLLTLWLIAIHLFRKLEDPLHKGLVLLLILAPTGSMVFRLLGYLDLVIYIMIVGALFLVSKNRVAAATVLIALTPLVHEIAILMALPLFYWFTFCHQKIKPQRLLMLVPLATSMLTIVLGRYPEAQVANFFSRLDEVGGFETDYTVFLALQLNPITNWKSFQLLHELLEVLPYFLAITTLWAASLTWAKQSGENMKTALGAALVSITPLLLVLGGFDTGRWITLACINTVAVLILWSRTTKTKQPVHLVLIAAIPFMLMFYAPLTYPLDTEKGRPIYIEYFQYIDWEYEFRTPALPN